MSSSALPSALPDPKGAVPAACRDVDASGLGSPLPTYSQADSPGASPPSLHSAVFRETFLLQRPEALLAIQTVPGDGAALRFPDTRPEPAGCPACPDSSDPADCPQHSARESSRFANTPAPLVEVEDSLSGLEGLPSLDQEESLAGTSQGSTAKKPSSPVSLLTKQLSESLKRTNKASPGCGPLKTYAHSNLSWQSLELDKEPVTPDSEGCFSSRLPCLSSADPPPHSPACKAGDVRFYLDACSPGVQRRNFPLTSTLRRSASEQGRSYADCTASLAGQNEGPSPGYAQSKRPGALYSNLFPNTSAPLVNEHWHTSFSSTHDSQKQQPPTPGAYDALRMINIW